MANKYTGESLTTTTAREYRKKFPKSPTLALARLLYKENKSLYTSVEGARTALRSIEGKLGKNNADKMKDKSLVLEKERPRNPYNLPEAEPNDLTPYELTSDSKRVLLLSDIHVPYHHIDAITLAMDYGKEKNVDTVILNGDTIDFYQLSRFEKDPRKRSVAHELEATRTLLKSLRDTFPEAKIIWKSGNHCVRLEKYLVIKAPELLGVEEVELKNLLKLKDFNIEYVTDKRIIKLQKLNILHGHEYPSVFSPVNVARGLFMKANACAIQGHNHQSSENTVVTINDEMITTWSTGCLCDLKPHYMPYNKWNLGFAYIESNEDSFEVFNKRIKDGKVF